MTTENFAQKLAKDAVDGLLKQAAKSTGVEVESNTDVKIDPETQRKLIEREIKMASDPDYELAELAKEKAAKRMRDTLSRGDTMTEEDRRAEEKRKADEELREKAERIAQAKALYTSCIEAGGDPKRCAEMVAGLIPSPQAAMMAPPATSITELVQALKALDDLRGSGGKTDSFTQDLAKRYLDNIDAQLKGPDKGSTQEVQTLRGEITSLRNEVRTMSDPVQIIGRAKALTDGLRSAGLIPESSIGSEPLEVVRERNRNAERMAEITVEGDYKTKITEIAGDAFESIGRGLASQVMEGGAEDAGSEGSQLKYFICPEKGCGTKIPITPETQQITCPKCKYIYQRTTA